MQWCVCLQILFLKRPNQQHSLADLFNATVGNTQYSNVGHVYRVRFFTPLQTDQLQVCPVSCLVGT